MSVHGISPARSTDADVTSAPASACRDCGLPHALPRPLDAPRYRCVRCGGRVPAPGDAERSRRRVQALALAALILYPAAVTLPIMRVSQLGHSHEAGVVSGGMELLGGGEVALGVLVLVCSVALPLIKLAGLLLLSARRVLPHRGAFWLHRFIEWTGKWGMLDVLLVAVLAALVKLGDLVRIEAGPGAILFTACVGLSLLASAAFDPELTWERVRREVVA